MQGLLGYQFFLVVGRMARIVLPVVYSARESTFPHGPDNSIESEARIASRSVFLLDGILTEI